MNSLRLEIPLGHGPEETFYAAVDRLMEALHLDLDLTKGLAPHAAQFQHRTPGGKFAKAADASHAPRLTAEECAAARDRARELQAELDPRLQTHLADWQAGGIDAAEWRKRAEIDLRHYYAELYRYGKRAAGNPGLVLSPQDKAVLNRLIEDELHYLAGFQEALATGGGKMPYDQRTTLYANASWEAYWTGYVMGDLRPGRELRWRFGATDEHCEDCARFVEMGWTDAKTFTAEVLAKGYAPRSGMLACTGVHCLCFLEERMLGEAEWPQAAPYAPAGAMREGAGPTSAGGGLADVGGGAADHPAFFRPRAPRAEPEAAQASPPAAEPVETTGRYLTEAELLAYGPAGGAGPSDAGAKAPIQAAEGDRNVFLAVLALAHLWPLRQGADDALRDATAYLYLNARDRAAYLNEPARAAKIATVGERGPVWLQARYVLTREQADEVFRLARNLGAYRVNGRFVSWALTHWAEPKLDAYPDLRDAYHRLRD